MSANSMLDQRKMTILEAVVRAYIREPMPVSSQWIVRHLPFELSSATIRNEMMALEDEGYLAQPHVSAGRVPTAAAFRFLASRLLEAEAQAKQATPRIDFHDPLVAAQRLARATGAVAFVSTGNSYSIVGFEFLLTAPEMDDPHARESFAKLIDDVYEWEERLRRALAQPIGVFVGVDNPILANEYFSIAAARAPRGGVAALLGPLRMDYERAVAALGGFLRK